jgi:hypothetical protein
MTLFAGLGIGGTGAVSGLLGAIRPVVGIVCIAVGGLLAFISVLMLSLMAR